jgi:hypothetical protein
MLIDVAAPAWIATLRVCLLVMDLDNVDPQYIFPESHKGQVLTFEDIVACLPTV